MVVLVSQFLDQTMLLNQWKAPSNHMFSIEDIHWTGISSGNNRVFVVDYLFEEKATNIDILSIDPIAVFDTTVQITQDIMFMSPLKTKFISLGLDNTSAMGGFIIILGNIIKASRTELLIEWFRKGR